MNIDSGLRQPRLDAVQSQRAFDALLHALAEPGTVRRLDVSFLTRPVPAAAIVTLALADVEVAINVDGDPSHPLAAVLCATTGASAAVVERAGMVTMTSPDPALVARCERGTALAPEEGARLAVRVEAVRQRPQPGDVTLRLSGPGVPGTRTVGLAGVPADFLDQLAVANADFPAGIDTWFVDDDGAICALSRSTHHTINGPPEKTGRH